MENNKPIRTGDGKSPRSGRQRHRRDPSSQTDGTVPKEDARRSQYKTVESDTLLEFHPLTGRTHQIRLHCAFLGCPIVGDEVYGRKKFTVEIDRHFLHAYRLKISLPGEKEKSLFEAPLPDKLDRVLVSLRIMKKIDSAETLLPELKKIVHKHMEVG
jgi:23S rRNA pseudouridine1911/1915/1917 synthase